jgi:hypothetical protein
MGGLRLPSRSSAQDFAELKAVLVDQVVLFARSRNGISTVTTFSPHRRW